MHFNSLQPANTAPIPRLDDDDDDNDEEVEESRKEHRTPVFHLVQRKFLAQRKIFLWGAVTDETALTHEFTEGISATYKKWQVNPVSLEVLDCIVEIDAMLQSLYDNQRVSPTAFIVNSQQGRDMLAKVAVAGSNTALRFTTAIAPDGVIHVAFVEQHSTTIPEEYFRTGASMKSPISAKSTIRS